MILPSLLMAGLLQAGAGPSGETPPPSPAALLDRFEQQIVLAMNRRVEAMSLSKANCSSAASDQAAVANTSQSVMWRSGRALRTAVLNPVGAASRFYLVDFDSGLAARFDPGVDGGAASVEVDALNTSEPEDFGWRASEMDGIHRYLRSLKAAVKESDAQVHVGASSLEVIVPCDPRRPRPSMLGVPANGPFLEEGSSIHYVLGVRTLEDGDAWWTLTVRLTGADAAVVRSSFFSGIGHEGLPFSFSHVIDFDRTGSSVQLSRFSTARVLDAASCEPFAQSFRSFQGATVRDRRLPSGHTVEYPLAGEFLTMDALRRMR